MRVFVDGCEIQSFPGETVATALLVAGIRGMRINPRYGKEAGLYCGMGICHECLVTVNDVPNVRACMTFTEPDMKIETWRYSADD